MYKNHQSQRKPWLALAASDDDPSADSSDALACLPIRRLSDDADMLYFVCALVADDDDGGSGRVEHLTEAMDDPSIVQPPRTIMSRAVT